MSLLTKELLDTIFKEWIENYGDSIDDFDTIQIQEYKYIWFIDEVASLLS